MPLKALSEVSRASVKAFPLSRWTWGRNYKNVARLNVTFLPCSPPPKYSFDIQFLKHIHICIHTHSTREFVFPFEIVKPFIIIRFKPRWYTLLISLSLSLLSSLVHATQKARSNKEEKPNLNKPAEKELLPHNFASCNPLWIYTGRRYAWRGRLNWLREM